MGSFVFFSSRRPGLPGRIFLCLLCLLLVLHACGEAQIPFDERAEEPAEASASQVPSVRPLGARSRPVTDEAIEIALWGGPLSTPLQKWRPQRTDVESEPDAAE